MSTFSWVYKPYTFWDPLPPSKKKSTHQHFWVPKIHMKITKIRPKKLKVYGKMLIFTDPHPSPRKCMFCTLVKTLTFLDSPLSILINYNIVTDVWAFALNVIRLIYKYHKLVWFSFVNIYYSFYVYLILSKTSYVENQLCWSLIVEYTCSTLQ